MATCATSHELPSVTHGAREIRPGIPRINGWHGYTRLSCHLFSLAICWRCGARAAFMVTVSSRVILNFLYVVVDEGGGDEHDALGDDVALAAEGDENRVVRVVVHSQELQGL